MKDYTKLTLKKIKKRDGRVVEFDPKHIERAISMAVEESKEFDNKETGRLSDIVVGILEKVYDGKLTPTVEQIQDVVEQVLMAAGHYDTAKRYIIYRNEKSKTREVKKIIGVVDDLGLPLNSLKVLENRFLMHDERGNVIETPRQLFTRVAKVLADVEKKDKKKWADAFFEVMSNLEFLPAGRTLNNAGTPQNQLANCFVLPIEDSMEGIFDAVKWTAIIHQKGGGTGFNFSKLRPKGDVVTKSSGGFATGPISFMKVFDTATRQVMQGGKKRGANMGILNVDHPDILEFITCKQTEGEISNFNISVGVTDKFMEAVVADKNYELVNPRDGEVVKRLSARTVFDQITALAWRTGDPGMIFLDAINRNNPLLQKYGRMEATNPCGEQPLHPFDACNLGSINLAKFVKDGKVNWKRLGEVVAIAVRMLDDVIDACNYPLPQISETVRQNRRIGLGVMGWADMLYRLGISYNSEEGIKLAEDVAKFIQDKSWEASEEVAKEKGVFPRWKDSEFATRKRRVRNVAITTIAPTGSISMVADCSSGIEPVFALSYTKNVVSDAGLFYTNKYFEEALENLVFKKGLEKDLILKEVSRTGSVNGVLGVTRELQKTFVVSHDIAPDWHVKMQSAWQKYTDNAVSKTINFPFEATIDDVEKAYISAWKAGCKGITVYRDRSKDVQILMKSTSSENAGSSSSYIIQSKIKVKPLEKENGDEKCPDCGAKMIFEEGCAKCTSCGYSYCKG